MRNLGLFGNINLSLSNEALAQRVEHVKAMLNEEMESDTESVPFLMILGGSEDGRIYPLKGSEVRIGRNDPEVPTPVDSDEAVVLPEGYGAVTRISKPHALLINVKGTWHIRDCGSTGGTYVNMVPVRQDQQVVLRDGDLISLSKGVRGAQFVITLPASSSS